MACCAVCPMISLSIKSIALKLSFAVARMYFLALSMILVAPISYHITLTLASTLSSPHFEQLRRHPTAQLPVIDEHVQHTLEHDVIELVALVLQCRYGAQAGWNHTLVR